MDGGEPLAARGDPHAPAGPTLNRRAAHAVRDPPQRPPGTRDVQDWNRSVAGARVRERIALYQQPSAGEFRRLGADR